MRLQILAYTMTIIFEIFHTSLTVNYEFVGINCLYYGALAIVYLYFRR